MPYKKVQFIAYCVHTGPKTISPSKEEYVGIGHTATDIAERIKLVKKAIESARVNSNTKISDPETLKIFMMPEFFFRGKTGAYTMEEASLVVSKLQELVKDKLEWEHWLFVFGSIISKSFETKAASLLERLFSRSPKRVVDSSKPIEVYNYVLVQKGGFGDSPESGPAAAKVVIKEHKSSMDFIKSAKSTGGLAFERVVHLSPVDSKKRSEEQQKEYDGSSVFEIDGIRFGLEVCLDHAEQRLKNSKNLPTIDIQLVPSCGMEIKERSIVAKPNGYIFHCDGYANYPEDKLGYDSRVKQINVVPPNNDIAPLDSKNISAAGIRIDEIYALGSGQIRIYPEQALVLAPLSSTRSVFPNEAGFTFSLADAPILLNGMKVLFDQPVSVYPVTLESKAKAGRDGN